MGDRYADNTGHHPVANLANVTPSDGTDLAVFSRAIYVGTAGAVKLTTVGGQDITTPTLAVGWHPIRASRIWSTGTTASNIMIGY